MNAPFYLVGWVTATSTTVLLGTIPIGTYVESVLMHVTQAFNSSGTDNISVGYSGTTNAYCTNTDVSTTGVKSPTAGAGVGYQTTARAVNAYYTPGVADQTTGKCLVIVKCFRGPISP